MDVFLCYTGPKRSNQVIWHCVVAADAVVLKHRATKPDCTNPLPGPMLTCHQHPNGFCAEMFLISSIKNIGKSYFSRGFTFPLGHWVTSWWHKAINWTNADLTSIRSHGIRLRAISQCSITCHKYTPHFPRTNQLTHWGRVTHICVSKLTITGSDNGLSPDRCQAIIWTNAGILLIGPLGTNFNEILIEIITFSFKKMRLKVSSAKWRPFCLGLNVLTQFGFHRFLP